MAPVDELVAAVLGVIGDCVARTEVFVGTHVTD